MINNNISVVRKFNFCYGHRIVDHPGKCKNIHGHNGIVHIHARSKDGQLDKLGMVVDFSILKDKIGKWIDENWDHKFLFWNQDDICCDIFDLAIPIHNSYVELDFNPTAENMAQYLLNIAPNLLGENNIEVFKVEFFETENCRAVVEKLNE